MVDEDMGNSEYSKFTPYYEQVGVYRGHFKKQEDFLIKIINKFNINGSVLDASCGTANVLNSLTIDYPESSFYGSDNCLEFIKQGQSKYKNIAKRINLVDWNNLRFNYKKNQFDFIFILGNSFAHIENTEQALQILEQIRFILKKNGYFLFDFRDWEENKQSGLYNLPSKSKEIKIEVGNKEFNYKTEYDFDNKAHVLNHIITNKDENVVDIKLKFNDFDNSTYVSLLNKTNFNIVQLFNKIKTYPFKGILAQKCN